MKKRWPVVSLRGLRDRKLEAGRGDPAQQERPYQQREQRGEVAPAGLVLVVRILFRGHAVVLPVLCRGLLRLGRWRSRTRQLVLVAEDPVAEQEGGREQDRREGAGCRSWEDALS